MGNRRLKGLERKSSRIKDKLPRFLPHISGTIRHAWKQGRIPHPSTRYLQIKQCDDRAGKSLDGLMEYGTLPVAIARVVAGSGYKYRTLDGKIFLKKIPGGKWEDNNERSFYEYVNSLTTSVKRNEQNPLDKYKELKPFLPRYFGTITTAEGNYLLLEDISSGMLFPSVIDLKLGKRSRGDERHCNGVCNEVNGAMIFQKSGEYLMVDLRDQWSTMSFQEARDNFREIFSHVPVPVRAGFVDFLKQVKRVLIDERNMIVRDCSVLLAWGQAADDNKAENYATMLIDFQKTHQVMAQQRERALEGLDLAIDWVCAVQ